METNEPHPLIRKPYPRVWVWKTWRKLWDEALYADQLIGLLHAAFDVDECYGEDWTDRLRFLLRVADGHRAASGLSDAVRPIADAAFKVLCNRYFRHRCGGHDRESTSVLGGQSPELFGTLLWFFHDVDRRLHGRNLPNDDRGHHDGIARRFVLELIKETWQLDHSPRYEGATVSDATEEAFIAARPKYVELLHELGELQFLHSERRRPIDQPTIDALRKIAFHDYSGKQIHGTAEEAVGTYAGQHLLIVEAKLRNGERQRRIAEAERKKRDAERELEAARK